MKFEIRVLVVAAIAVTASAQGTLADYQRGQAMQAKAREQLLDRLVKVLDLKSPDIHDVMSADEIAAALPNPDETELDGPETVQVHGAVPAPYVPGGFAALYWAVTHPLQSWRVLAPVQ